MQKDVAVAINNVNKRLNETSQQLDRLLNQKTDSLENEITDTQMVVADSYEENLTLQEELTNTQLALADSYEENLRLQEELTNTQLVVTDLYEIILELQGGQ